MKILAIETSTYSGSIAVVTEDSILGEYYFNRGSADADRRRTGPCAGGCLSEPVARRSVHRQRTPRKSARQHLAGEYRRWQSATRMGKLLQREPCPRQPGQHAAAAGLLLPFGLLARLERHQACPCAGIQTTVLVSRWGGRLGTGGPALAPCYSGTAAWRRVASPDQHAPTIITTKR